jgi:general L-amino acid transport system permease protein
VSGKRETVIAAVRRDWRNIALQGLLVVVLAWGVSWLVANASANLQRQNIASGFGFLQRTAGFDISQRLIAYANTDTYALAFWVGLTNTLLVAGVSMVLATLAGFALGIARLSPNWLIAKLALVYVEIVRNVPLLLWLFLIYFGVLLRLPPPQASWHVLDGGLLNQRGLYLPSLMLTLAWLAVIGLAVVTGVLAVALNARGKIGFARIGLLFVPAVVGAMLAGPLSLQRPVLERFNVTGGLEILPELMALTIGLVTYTAAYIGEIVRAGIQSVARGQRQAASALGLTDRDALHFIVVPQALRAIVPPLTNQYVNLAKNSSLAVAVGYPDLVSVFAGTILNHTNQAVETIAITMAVYLTLSLAIASAMGVLNARVALKGR